MQYPNLSQIGIRPRLDGQLGVHIATTKVETEILMMIDRSHVVACMTLGQVRCQESW